MGDGCSMSFCFFSSSSSSSSSSFLCVAVDGVATGGVRRISTCSEPPPSFSFSSSFVAFFFSRLVMVRLCSRRMNLLRIQRTNFLKSFSSSSNIERRKKERKKEKVRNKKEEGRRKEGRKEVGRRIPKHIRSC